MILCDIGNTTYSFKHKNKFFKLSVFEDKANFIKFNPSEQIYFISVNDKATKKFLDIYPNSINLEKFISFKTKYKGIGIDRKVVCSSFKDAIIIDAGSAITVDIMKKGIHKGGFILPGLNSYKKIYPKISKKLIFDFKNDINLDKMPLKTNDAINYAIFDSVILPILKVYKTYKLPLYFTGGDGKVLCTRIKAKKKEYKKSLIFKGMKQIVKTIEKEIEC